MREREKREKEGNDEKLSEMGDREKGLWRWRERERGIKRAKHSEREAEGQIVVKGEEMEKEC